MTEITTSFEVGEQWYDMSYRLLRAVQAALGDDCTNKAIIDWINARKHKFVIEQRGNFIHIRLNR